MLFDFVTKTKFDHYISDFKTKKTFYRRSVFDFSNNPEKVWNDIKGNKV